MGVKGVIGWISKDLEKEQELIFPWRWRTEPAQTIPSVVAGPWKEWLLGSWCSLCTKPWKPAGGALNVPRGTIEWPLVQDTELDRQIPGLFHEASARTLVSQQWPRVVIRTNSSRDSQGESLDFKSQVFSSKVLPFQSLSVCTLPAFFRAHIQKAPLVHVYSLLSGLCIYLFIACPPLTRFTKVGNLSLLHATVSPGELLK